MTRTIQDVEANVAALQTPLTMAERFSGGYWQTQPHHRVIWNEVKRLLYSKDQDALIVKAGPRHGKSEFLSRWFPAWYLGHNPSRRVMLNTHTGSLAKFHSAWVRDKVHQLAPLFGLKGVDPMNSSATDWSIDGGGMGGMLAAGVGSGTVTGRGADCLSGLSMVSTELGEIMIQDLVEMEVKPRVWSYDHVSGRVVLRRIVATRKAIGRATYLVGTECGKRLATTGDHRIFTHEAGYTASRSLGRLGGDFTGKARLRLRWQEKQEGKDLPSVFVQSASGSRQGSLYDVRRRVREARLRDSQVTEAWSRQPVLWGSLSRQAQRCQDGRPQVQPLRSNTTEGQAVLFQRLQGGSVAQKEKQVPCGRVRSVQGQLRKGNHSTAFLLSRLREQSSFDTDDGVEQFAPSQGRQPNKDCQGRSTVHCRARQCKVRGVQLRSRTTDASHRRSTGKQPTGQSGYVVRDVPRGAPSFERVRLGLVGRLRTAENYVYDIQVEGTSNFFANGILVHNCILIDDYLRNAADAQSERIRDKIWEWFTATISTRREPGGKLVLLCTQWHSDDLIGRLLSKRDEHGLNIRCVTLQTLREENGTKDPLRRQPGEALWPSRFPADVLEKQKKIMGAYWWSCQFQGKPINQDGQYFPDEYFSNIWCSDDEWPERFDVSAVFLDPSQGKDSKKGDYQALTFVGYKDGRYYVDSSIDRQPVPKLMRHMAAWCKEREPSFVGIEANAFQNLLAPHYIEACEEIGYWVTEPDLIDNTIGKHIRVQRLGGWLERRDLRFKKNASNELLLQQMKNFPNGKHDDGPDSLEACLRLLCNSVASMNDLAEPEMSRLI